MHLKTLKNLIKKLSLGDSQQGGAMMIAVLVVGVASVAIHMNTTKMRNTIKESFYDKNHALSQHANDFALRYAAALFTTGPDVEPGLFPDPYFKSNLNGVKPTNITLVNTRNSFWNIWAHKRDRIFVNVPNLRSIQENVYDKDFRMGEDKWENPSHVKVFFQSFYRTNPDHPLLINELRAWAQHKIYHQDLYSTETRIRIPAPVPKPILELKTPLNTDDEIDGDTITVDLLADGVLDFGRVYLVYNSDVPGKKDRIVGDPVDVATEKDNRGFPLHNNDSVQDRGEFLGTVTFTDVESGNYTIYGQAIGVDGLITETKINVKVDNVPVYVEQTEELPPVVRLVDYLFLLDNSGSMAKIIAGVRKGFESIEDPSIYPDNARLAVMNTMPADPNGGSFNNVHPDERNYAGREFEPGFMKLIDAHGINQFQNHGSTRYGLRFDHEGCSAWFQPGETNGDGIPCIEAHTQISGGTSYETGKVTFSQMVQKTNNLFRNNALVNVIFISDTHDPGRSSERIEAMSRALDYNTLLAQTQASNNIDSLKFHAIAPGEPCNGEGSWGLSYFPLVQESGGRKTEFCNSENYRSFLESMLERGASETITVQLAHPQDPFKVFVDGKEKPASEYTRDATTNELHIQNVRRKGETRIRIIFEM